MVPRLLLASTPTALALGEIVAQAGPEGIGAWTVFTSGSAAILLGAVLWWFLFKYLPYKDKQLIDLIAIKDQQIRQAIEDAARERKEDWADRREERRLDREYCSVELEAQRTILREERGVIARLDRLEAMIAALQGRKKKPDHPGPEIVTK